MNEVKSISSVASELSKNLEGGRGLNLPELISRPDQYQNSTFFTTMAFGTFYGIRNILPNLSEIHIRYPGIVPHGKNAWPEQEHSQSQSIKGDLNEKSEPYLCVHVRVPPHKKTLFWRSKLANKYKVTCHAKKKGRPKTETLL